MKKQLDFNPKYSISSDGYVYGPMGKMKPTFGLGCRYPLIRIRHPKTKKVKFFAIHILVAENFIGPKPFPEAVVRHKNDIKTQNNHENLEWGTRRQNMADAKRNGTRIINGENNPNSKLTNTKVTEIRKRLAGGEILKNLAFEFGVSVSQIFRIKHNKRWVN